MNPNIPVTDSTKDESTPIFDETVQNPEPLADDAPPVEDPEPTQVAMGGYVHRDQDPEDHIGHEIKDPWSDDDQTDWPNNDGTDTNG